MSSNEWKKKNMTQFSYSPLNSTGIPGALRAYLDTGKENKTQFFSRIVQDELIKLGFDPKDYIITTAADE